MDIVATAAQQYTGNPALVTEKQSLSFRNLETTTARIAGALIQKEISGGDTVAFCMPNSPDMVLLLLALLRFGVVSAPLNYRFPTHRLQALLPPLNPTVLIGTENLTERLSFPGKLTPEEITGHTAQQNRNTRQLNSSTTQQQNPLTTIIHTSSSSGNPKAALHSLGNHYYSALGSNENIPFAPGDRWLLSLPLFHIGGYAILFRSLLGGGAVVVPSGNENISESVKRHSITHLSLVPTQLYRLLEDPDSHDRLKRLKAILLGGSTVEPALLNETSALQLPVYLSYGSTEMSSQITTTPSPAGTITAGKVLPYRELSIGPGDEILVKGPCLFQGYLSENGPVLETDSSGWFHTGDTGTLSPEGELQVTGRTDNMFISGGENIHPEEIERALNALEGIEKSIVIPATDKEYGFRPAAFIETSENAPEDKEIIDSLSHKIGKLKTPVAITRIKEWCLLPGTEKIDRGYYKRKVEG